MVVIGRDPDRTNRARDRIAGATGGDVHGAVADMGELDQVRALAARLMDDHPSST